MNDKELIERLKNRGIFGTKNLQGGINWTIGISVTERDAIIKSLSRTRIRNTAEENCEYCKDEQLPIFEADVSRKYNPVTKISVKFCPNCGRELPEQPLQEARE